MQPAIRVSICLLVILLMIVLSGCGASTAVNTVQPSAPTIAPTVPPSSTPEPTNTPVPTFTSTPTEIPPTPTITSTPPPLFTEADCPKAEVLCIGLVTQEGGIEDHAFNQSIWKAIQKYPLELPALVNYIETSKAEDYAANIASFADRGYDVVVTVGFPLSAATVEAAYNYPDTYFIGVDQLQTTTRPNLVGLVFHEDQAGFLAGALAASLSQSGTVAGVYGMDIPAVVAFHDGFQAGAEYINPDITVISTYHPTDDIAFSDPEWGAATAAEAILQGADVIFAAAGGTGTGALVEAASHPGLLCIGVDSDQWQTTAEAHPCLVSSAMKLTGEGVYSLIQAYWQGERASGNYYGQVGLSAFYAFENLVPQPVKDKLAAVLAALADGSLSTGYTAP